MNTFPMALAWCVLQVTLLATIAIVWYVLLRRAGPGARSLALFTGLSLIVLLTALSVSPWPRWPEWSLSASSPPVTSAPGEVPDSPEEVTSGAASPPVAVSPAAPPPAIVQFWNALGNELRSQTRPVVRDEWTWPVVLAALMVVGAGFGFGRLCLGLILVRTYRRRSRPITSSEILELCDVLQAELGCRRKIDLFESDTLVTAATVGWKRPLVILPSNWRSWTAEERLAVMAHEIAHIQRHDFFTWVAAQVALVLHFYHPFVHWLCGRLRLEQELAADAAAARLSGGQQTYLTTLAAMALRQTDRPLAWPARTFLPTRGTFMRRIEMLRDSRVPAATLSSGMRVATVGVLLIAGLFVAGFRGGSGTADAGIGDLSIGGLTSAGAIGAAEPVSLAYVPRDAVVVATARPIEILARPELAPLRKSLDQRGALNTPFGIAMDRIEQITLVMLPREVAPNVSVPAPAGIILRLAKAEDVDAIIKTLLPDAQEAEYATQKYLKRVNGPPTSAMRADERTLVFCEDEPSLKRMIVAGETGASTTKWADAWGQVSRNEAAVLVNVAAIRTSLDESMKHAPAQGPGAMLMPLAPLWQKADVAALSLQFGQSLKLEGILNCSAAADAMKVQETLSAALTFAKNALSQGRAAAARSGQQDSAMLLGLLDIGDTMLDGAKVNVADKKVELTATVAAKEMTVLGSLMVPALNSARSAAKRTQSINNLKQIGLAMHNYADTFRSFPPAVLYGPDGKTPYSWRVALLPYLEQEALYRQYNFNEPWDSETNKKVLEKMPVIYRDPADPDASRNSSYFVLTGPQTIFSGKAGTTLPQITDGLSNTLMVVEAKRDIPWTKPEDIPYDREKAMPKLGGHHEDGFIALVADGSVRFILKNVEENLLRMLITKDGGEAIPQF